MKRGAPLRRKTPLKRTGPIKAKPPRRLKGAGADPGYLAAVRGLPCCSPDRFCDGPIHAHHAGRRPGVALKAPDSTAIPLCQVHHARWHAGVIGSWGWHKGDRRIWADARIAETRRLVEGLAGGERAA